MSDRGDTEHEMEGIRLGGGNMQDLGEPPLPSPVDQDQSESGGPRGFAAMSAERQREIASEGGHAAQARGMMSSCTRQPRNGSRLTELRWRASMTGTAHKLTDKERSRGGKVGGQTTAQDRRHMSEIGSKGGHVAQETGAYQESSGRRVSTVLTSAQSGTY